MTQVPNDTLSAFAALQGQYTQARAEIGGQVEWPPEGDHNAYIIGLNLSTGQFRESDGNETPSAIAQFVYQLMDDPDRVEPLSWPGSAFGLPLDTAALTTNGGRTRAEIEMNRLKGFIKVLKGGEPDGDFVADLLAIKGQIDDPNTDMAVKLRCQYRPAKKGGGFYRTDFIKEVLSGNVPTATP